MTTDYYEDDYYEDYDPAYYGYAPPSSPIPLLAEEVDLEFTDEATGLDVFLDFGVIEVEVDEDAGEHDVEEISLDFFEVRGADDDWYRPPTPEEADAILRAFDWQAYFGELVQAHYEDLLEAEADSRLL